MNPPTASENAPSDDEALTISEIPTIPQSQIPTFTGYVTTKELPKEMTARTVAHSLLLTFRVSLWGILLLGFATIIVDHWSGKGQADVLIKDSVVPMLTSAGTFGSTLFGPLLAFVLGYYFGERKNQ